MSTKAKAPPSLPDICASAARAWFREQCGDAYLHCYLWYFPTDMPPGLAPMPDVPQLRVAPEAPGPFWRLGANERISPAWTVDQAAAFIYGKARSLPLLPPSYVLSGRP